MAEGQTNLLQGTLDLLILKAIGEGELHGLGISRRIEQITRGTFLVKPGSLFPALHRMEEAGWLTSFWGESENNRRAKYYRRTKAGERQLQVETEQWSTMSGRWRTRSRPKRHKCPCFRARSLPFGTCCERTAGTPSWMPGSALTWKGWRTR